MPSDALLLPAEARESARSMLETPWEALRTARALTTNEFVPDDPGALRRPESVAPSPTFVQSATAADAAALKFATSAGRIRRQAQSLGVPLGQVGKAQSVQKRGASPNGRASSAAGAGDAISCRPSWVVSD